MKDLLWVGVGGFLGAVSRFSIAQAVRGYTQHPFPLATLAVNFLGCLAAGFLYEYLRDHALLPLATLFVAIGFLGSFTTFSAFGFETIQLIRNHSFGLALVNVGGNLILCLLAVSAGILAGSALRS